ncbi:MAG: hypothetical protein COA53_07340 [Rhodobacteraceae bacterium]|nr:MAG: hypothetical protein COA53_07340 [Paracoccaceae bacterium]
MTDNEEAILIKEIELPFQKSATLKDVTLFGGMKVLRMTFRERKRFTMIDLDPANATSLANDLLAWAEENK